MRPCPDHTPARSDDGLCNGNVVQFPVMSREIAKKRCATLATAKAFSSQYSDWH